MGNRQRGMGDTIGFDEGMVRRSDVASGASRKAVLVFLAVAILGELLGSHSAAAPPTADDEAAPVDPMDEPLVSDRPDFTESAEVIPKGHVQLEMGYTFTYDREHEDRTREHTAPELLVRLGLLERFELRIGWEGYNWTDNQFEVRHDSGRRETVDDWSQGANDLSLGFKYKFCDQEGPRPNFGIIAGMTVPSGSADVSSGDVDPGVVFLWAYDLTERLSLAGNVGVSAPTEDSERFVQSSASISLAMSITDRLGSYVEYFGIYPNADGTDCAHSVDGGLTFAINNNFQLDWRIRAGLNEEADDFFTGVGLAMRF